MELGHFNKLFVKNARKKDPTEKHLGVFSPRHYKIYLLNEKFNPKMDTIWAFFSKIKKTFLMLKKGRRGAPVPPLIAHLWVWLNMHQYLWISLNILEKAWVNCWLYQGPEYAWSSYMFDRFLKMPQNLNVPGFWIWQSSLCKGCIF